MSSVITATATTTTATATTNEQSQRGNNFGSLRALAKQWGRSRSTNHVVAIVKEQKSLSSSTISSSSTVSLLSGNNSVVTEDESRGGGGGGGHHHNTSSSCSSSCIPVEDNDHEIRQVPSQESDPSPPPSLAATTTSDDMEEESATSSVESSDSCLDLAGNRKRSSSLDKLDTSQSIIIGGGPHDHVPKQARSTLQDASKTRDRFMSILDRPFQYWHEVNMVLKEIHPHWSPYQRGRMIHHLIHFLELKIGRDEYFPTGLLFPTPVVDSAWRALVIETSLYLKIIYALQDFHSKNREMIHYTMILNRELLPKEVEDKIRRTQSLFLVYFKEIMPLSIEDEPRHPPALVPFYHREQNSSSGGGGGATPTFATGSPTKHQPKDTMIGTIGTSTTILQEQGDATMLELSSLSLKDVVGGSVAPQEDDTASTEHSIFSGG